MKTFYDIPTQVMFHDESGWNAGIAFEDKVICACCGEALSIENLIANCDENIANPIYEYKAWIPLTDEITGDLNGMPAGLMLTEDYVIKEAQQYYGCKELSNLPPSRGAL